MGQPVEAAADQSLVQGQPVGDQYRREWCFPRGCAFCMPPVVAPGWTSGAAGSKQRSCDPARVGRSGRTVLWPASRVRSARPPEPQASPIDYHSREPPRPGSRGMWSGAKEGRPPGGGNWFQDSFTPRPEVLVIQHTRIVATQDLDKRAPISAPRPPTCWHVRPPASRSRTKGDPPGSCSQPSGARRVGEGVKSWVHSKAAS